MNQNRQSVLETKREVFLKSVKEGTKKGARSYVWIMKILVPVSFLTALLAWSGLLEKCSFIVEPIMSLIRLPACAALPLIIGTTSTIYGTVAAMAFLPLTLNQMSFIAVFILITHGLLFETSVQAKSGMPAVKAVLVRLVTSIITIWIMGLFIDTSGSAAPLMDNSGQIGMAFSTMAYGWFKTTLYLSVKIFFIIITILSIMEIMKNFGWINYIIRFCGPVFTIMGISKNCGFIWLTSQIFGILYGSAIIMEETREKHFEKHELDNLHVSIGINHAMVEDPCIFLILGINPFLLWLPRLIAALIAVRINNLLRPKRVKVFKPGHQEA